jgi:hypothetical protein
MSNNFVIDTLTAPPAANLSVTDIVAPYLVAKLRRSRDWLIEDDQHAFTDDTLRRVLDFLARNTRMVSELDAAAGSDGSIGILFERGCVRLYADYLGNGNIRVFSRDLNGAESRFITEDSLAVSAALRDVAPVIGEIQMPSGDRSCRVVISSGGATSREPTYSIYFDQK